MWINYKEVVVCVYDEWAEITILLHNLSIMNWVKWRSCGSGIFNADWNEDQRSGKTLPRWFDPC